MPPTMYTQAYQVNDKKMESGDQWPIGQKQDQKRNAITIFIIKKY